ncbi:MAG: HEPN domain-containing protein [Defluviitaleaceae bacterium]|nr:HEPN domain-containing protein [Defluviitaleaceae bacterium]
MICNTGDAPRTHDIEILHELCKEYMKELNLSPSITRALTRFATKARYPDDVYDFTDVEMELALKYAEQILGQIKQFLGIA